MCNYLIVVHIVRIPVVQVHRGPVDGINVGWPPLYIPLELADRLVQNSWHCRLRDTLINHTV